MPSECSMGTVAVLEADGRRARRELRSLRMYGVLVTLPFPSSASAVVSSDTPGSYIASSNCKSFPAPMSVGGFSPPPVSCGEVRPLYSYRVSVHTIWPIKVSIRALQNIIIYKYNYIHQNPSLGPWMLRSTTKTTETTPKNIICPP